jgi:hypothetical protein
MFCDQTIIWKCLCSGVDEVGIAHEDSSDYRPGSTHAQQLNLLLRGTYPRKHENHDGDATDERLATAGKLKLWDSFLKIFPDKRHEDFDLAARAWNNHEMFAVYCTAIVSPYNRRNFTRASDLPRAFEGLAQALTQNAAPGSLFSQGLCWGLPVAYLPNALTWCPAEEHLRPRDQALGFPSWSWMAWEGTIRSYRALYGRVEFKPKVKLVPMCEWDIVYPSSESTPRHSSLQSPNYDQRTTIRVTGEMCTVDVGSWIYREPEPRWRLQTGYWQATLGTPRAAFIPSHLVALFPDQVDGILNHSVKSVDLLGISKFEASYRGFSPPNGRQVHDSESSTYVKALWVIRSDEASVVGGGSTVPRFQRRGVAIVSMKGWRRGRQKGGKRLKVLLE